MRGFRRRRGLQAIPPRHIRQVDNAELEGCQSAAGSRSTTCLAMGRPGSGVPAMVCERRVHHALRRQQSRHQISTSATRTGGREPRLRPGLRSAQHGGQRRCGALSSSVFGTLNLTSHYYRGGADRFGVRPASWQGSVLLSTSPASPRARSATIARGSSISGSPNWRCRRAHTIRIASTCRWTRGCPTAAIKCGLYDINRRSSA
jgi:hypothetical protein